MRRARQATRARATPAPRATPRQSERPREGARGALLDEYERAIRELQSVIAGMDEAALAFELYPDEPDANCRSVGSILEHVVRAGNNYPTYILRHRRRDATLVAPKRTGPATVEALSAGMDDMFAYTVDVLARLTEREMTQKAVEKLVVTPWGQRFDYDQMMEHAIVHILRHRRQIERYRQELDARRRSRTSV